MKLKTQSSHPFALTSSAERKKERKKERMEELIDKQR
jgi:hypothetical protein